MAMKDRAPSRRGIFKAGIAAAAGGIALAQSQATRRFRGWVSRGTGTGRTTLQELTLRPITGRQVVVRTEATNLCYSNAAIVLGASLPGAPVRPATGLQAMALI